MALCLCLHCVVQYFFFVCELGQDAIKSLDYATLPKSFALIEIYSSATEAKLFIKVC